MVKHRPPVAAADNYALDYCEGSSSYSPQPPGPFCLVDVDEVGHHAALEQAALSLHPDLEHRKHTPACDLTCLGMFHSEVVRFTLRTSVGLARQEDMTPDTTPQNTLMTIVSSAQTTITDHHSARTNPSGLG